jgi:bifunctional non-homologous end joining protein LigD
MALITIDNQHIELSNENKVLFPISGITKGHLITYYTKIAPYMVPHIYNHPIAMHRFPDGINQEGFYQKERGTYFPDWIDHKAIKRKSDNVAVQYVLCNNAATLVYLANQATITYHAWLSSTKKLNHPDRMIFDLDPSHGTALHMLKDAVQYTKNILEHQGLTPFIMTTGSKGFHIIVPILQHHTFKTVQKYASMIAHQLLEKYPTLFTIELRKEKRKEKIFIDVLRNQWAQLSVAPYSVRAIEHAPIATPIPWSKLNDTRVTPQYYTINNIFTQLDAHGDAWQHFAKHAHKLPKTY